MPKPNPDTIPAETTPSPSRNPLRRLYAWMLSWADRPGGTWALAALGFAESSVFPVPPDPLLMALCLGKPRRSFYFAAVLSIASVAGGMVGYAIGMYLSEAWSGWFLAIVPGLTQDKIDWMCDLYGTNNMLAVFTAGFTPIPYKLFTIAAGYCKISFPIFVIASVVSRSARFFLVATLLYFFGPPIERFIDRHLGWLSILFVILLVSGFLLFR